MIEVHDPIRLMILVEHYPDVILKTIKSDLNLYQWFINEWVHLVSIHPDTNEFYYFKNGSFTTYDPLTQNTLSLNNIHSFIEGAKEMDTNYIVDATKENLAVHLIK